MVCRTGGVDGAGTAVALVLLLLTAGCSQEPDAALPTTEPGPAEVYLEAGTGYSSDEAPELTVRFEELIAACMQEQGFEYVPDVDAHVLVDDAEIEPPPGTRAFAEQFGYGFAAAPEGMRVSGSSAGPNQVITDAMSPEEYDAYTRALMGDAIADATAAGEGSGGGGSDGGGSDGETELGGCYRGARNEVYGDREQDHIRAGLEDEIARIDAEVAPTDPHVMAAAAEWSECMSDAGHPGYAAPPDAEEAAWAAWLALNEGIAADPALGTAGPDGGIAGEGDLATREASLATADFDCRIEAEYDAVWQEARDRLQQEYVDAHRAELDAWVEELS